MFTTICLTIQTMFPHSIRAADNLGSGQFGVVSKGVWQSPKGPLEVAVKQLQPGASEDEKVKFLQEAAINGQFRHPNVVQLMGVVTVGEPVSQNNHNYCHLSFMTHAIALLLLNCICARQ